MSGKEMLYIIKMKNLLLMCVNPLKHCGWFGEQNKIEKIVKKISEQFLWQVMQIEIFYLGNINNSLFATYFRTMADTKDTNIQSYSQAVYNVAKEARHTSEMT